MFKITFKKNSRPYHIVTGIGNSEWKWLTPTKSRYREIGQGWGEIINGGADMFECLSRPDNRHQIKYFETNPDYLVAK